VTKTREVILEHNFIADQGAKFISDAISNTLARTEILKLGDNQVEDQGAANLADGLKATTHLKRIYVSGNLIKTKGAKELATAFKASSCLEMFDISGTTLEPEAVRALVNALVGEVRDEEKRLHISFPEQWTEVTRGMTKLDLHGRCLSEQWAGVLGAILESCDKIGNLDLWGSTVSKAAATKLADVVRRSRTKIEGVNGPLIRLGLKDCKIGDGAAGDLAVALETCHSLQRLELNGNEIKDGATIKLADSLKKTLWGLVDLNLWRNEIKNLGAAAMAEAFAVHQTLKILNISQNLLTDEAGVALAVAMNKRAEKGPFPPGSELDVRGSRFSQEVVDKLGEGAGAAVLRLRVDPA